MKCITQEIQIGHDDIILCHVYVAIKNARR